MRKMRESKARIMKYVSESESKDSGRVIVV
jgi:hypothetical protein